jgi:hypothetical protein
MGRSEILRHAAAWLSRVQWSNAGTYMPKASASFISTR